MKNKEILEKLDFIDKYIQKNVNESGKLQNVNDFAARINLGVLQQIRNELENKCVGNNLTNRIEVTENALLYIMDRAKLNPNNKYFEWQKSTEKDTYYSKPDVQDIYNCIITGHLPNVLADYADLYLPFDITGREVVIEAFRTMEKEYNDFLAKDNQETSLMVRKRNPLQKLFDKIFKREKKEKNANNEIENYKTTSGHRKYCEELRNIENYTNAQENNTTEKDIKEQKEVIAVSDLHGNIEKWNELKDYLEKNPNTKTLILGDATDRGEYGIEILMQIKEMCDNGQAEYLPGNHDIFLYNYVKTNEILSRLTDDQKWQNQNIVKIAGRELAHLTRNGGEITLEGLRNFDNIVKSEIRKGNIKNKISKQELINWLGSQPVQKKINVDNKNFALAHAWFDEKLYNYDPNFNMEKVLALELYGEKDNIILNQYRNIMWYREKDARTHYAEVDFPENCTMIVGHTPQMEGMNVRCFSGDPDKQTIYIDTGNNLSIFNLSNSNRSIEYTRK